MTQNANEYSIQKVVLNFYITVNYGVQQCHDRWKIYSLILPQSRYYLKQQE